MSKPLSRLLNVVTQGDCRDYLRGLPDGTVQCCVTSPPYWGLRDYGVDGQIGQEPTPDAYVQTMVEVFREVRRVLHDSGTVWLNVGDSYAQSEVRNRNGENPDFYRPCRDGVAQTGTKMNYGLKPKDLCLIPWRLAIALQADGWWVRSVICWAKKSCMPESVTDRPTNSWEPIFLLAKSAKYFYDAESVKEQAQDWSTGGPGTGIKETYHYAPTNGGNAGLKGIAAKYKTGDMPNTRNQRNVWHLGPEPYAEAHFATFPTEIPRRAILAGTSAKGCCPKCREPWGRRVHRTRVKPKDYEGKYLGTDPQSASRRLLGNVRARRESGEAHDQPFPPARTVGWEPGCECNAGDPVPCIVLDPFAGSGTTLAVAMSLKRDALGCDLSASYVVDLAHYRVKEAATGVSAKDLRQGQTTIFDEMEKPA